MNIEKRKTLSKLLAASSLIATPQILLAEDYSNNSNPFQKKYTYTPFSNRANNINSQESAIITNNILPYQNQQSFWNLPRTIHLHRTVTGENAKIVYFNDGRINQQGYRLACYLLRDVQQNAVTNMDLRLLDLICAVQAWLTYYGINKPLMVNSGFRTARTNGSLEGAAKKSMHLSGRAIDFSVPGMSVAAVAKLAAHFRGGGIGIYPSQNFIHLDTGGVRVWVKR
jgi:uncharacterized protein YcbK (DUF882 family)